MISKTYEFINQLYRSLNEICIVPVIFILTISSVFYTLNTLSCLFSRKIEEDIDNTKSLGNKLRSLLSAPYRYIISKNSSFFDSVYQLVYTSSIVISLVVFSNAFQFGFNFNLLIQAAYAFFFVLFMVFTIELIFGFFGISFFNKGSKIKIFLVHILHVFWNLLYMFILGNYEVFIYNSHMKYICVLLMVRGLGSLLNAVGGTHITSVLSDVDNKGVLHLIHQAIFQLSLGIYAMYSSLLSLIFCFGGTIDVRTYDFFIYKFNGAMEIVLFIFIVLKIVHDIMNITCAQPKIEANKTPVYKLIKLSLPKFVSLNYVFILLLVSSLGAIFPFGIVIKSLLVMLVALYVFFNNREAVVNLNYLLSLECIVLLLVVFNCYKISINQPVININIRHLIYLIVYYLLMLKDTKGILEEKTKLKAKIEITCGLLATVALLLIRLYI